MKKEKNADTEEETEKKGKKKTGRRIVAIVVCVACFFGGFFTYRLTLDPELRSLLWLKRQVQREYAYKVSDKDFYSAVFEGVNRFLLDPYSEYMTKSEYAETVADGKGNATGLGLVFYADTGANGLLVSRVAGNSPAETVGIKEGDVIKAFAPLSGEETVVQDYETFSSFVKATDENTEIRLKVERGGVESEVRIARSAYKENYVFYRTSTTSVCFAGSDALQKTVSGDIFPSLPTDTAYLRLTLFNGSAAKQFAKAMDVFKSEGKKHLLLDLRGNGGGYMDILCSIARYFCKNGGSSPVVAKAVDKKGKTEKFCAKSSLYADYFSSDSKIAVLADNGTASAAECLMGCMLDYGALESENVFLAGRTENGATVYKTYGKGIMQTTFVRFPLWESEAVRLTTAKIVWPKSGTCIHGVGITEATGARGVAQNRGRDEEAKSALALFFA